MFLFMFCYHQYSICSCAVNSGSYFSMPSPHFCSVRILCVLRSAISTLNLDCYRILSHVEQERSLELNDTKMPDKTLQSNTETVQCK